MNPFKPQPLASLLALSFYGRRVSAIAMKRINGQVRVVGQARTMLSLDPLTQSEELVAQELRGFLDQHELRETKCLVCLPSNLVLTTSIEIPELSEEDRQSYLDLQAETEFPFAADEISLSSVAFQAPDQSRHATLAALPKTQVGRLERILQQAKLRPISLTLGIQPSPTIEPSSPHLILNVHPDHVDLAIQCDNGYAAIRSLDEVYETEGADQVLDHDLLQREIKITLGQLSGAVRPHLKHAIVSHDSPPGADAAESLQSTLQGMGLKTTPVPSEHNPLHRAAESFLINQNSNLEFLPPKETQFQALAKKVSSRRNAWVGGSVGAIVALTVIVYSIQGYRLRSLENEWAGMADTVTELEALQGRIRQFRPWFTRSVESLEIAKQLSGAFPREGSLWVKSVQIKENQQVLCSGSARNNQELLTVMDELRGMEHISELMLQQVRGEAPVQFAFQFQWKSGGQ